jgi:hypothetical protein
MRRLLFAALLLAGCEGGKHFYVCIAKCTSGEQTLFMKTYQYQDVSGNDADSMCSADGKRDGMAACGTNAIVCDCNPSE